ncbi:MAG: DNA-processing protein DprA [Gemmatimonadaceae bacterium]
MRGRTTASPSPDPASTTELRLVGRGDTGYPSALHDLPDAPADLWTLGRLELTAVRPVVAIVGTRDATPYGERVARELTRALVRAGACVVSGLARGIDATAHRTTLGEGGSTIAVLGTGIDVPYPVGHRALQGVIAERGLLLSEFPPGTRATRGCFPRRNRIIAALATVTIVVEAGVHSGALITAGRALNLGRTVAAVPGPIDVPQCEGSNHLLRDGAVVIADVADALTLVGLTPPVRSPRVFRDPDAAAVWAALAAGPLDSDSLCARSGLPAHRCLAAVTELELEGAIECTLTGSIRRR